jgi:hypothetical protein
MPTDRPASGNSAIEIKTMCLKTLSERGNLLSVLVLPRQKDAAGDALKTGIFLHRNVCDNEGHLSLR